MRRPIRNCVGLVIFLVAIAAAFYTQRVRIGDLIGESAAPELPAAMAYKETAAAVPVVGQPVIERSVIDEAIPVDEKIAASPAAPRNDTVASLPPPNPLSSEAPAPGAKDGSIPSSFNLAVPFTSQAPFSNWDAVHEETCEEAAIYMVASFYEGVTGKVDPTVAEAELQRLVAIENATFGYYKDTTADETARLAKLAYGYSRVDLLDDPTADQIKAFVASGHPVIVPTAGRMLHNPNFTGDGPPYHMVVIRGYADTQFVTNDPGTRRGEAYVYSIDTVMAAAHDWNGGDVENGKKVMIVTYPL